MENKIRFDNLKYVEDDSTFRLSNGYGDPKANIRIHAFGIKGNSKLEEAQARFAVRVTKKHKLFGQEISQFLGQDDISAVEAGKVDDKVFRNTFLHPLGVLVDPKSNWNAVCYMMSQLDEVCKKESVLVKMWTYSMYYFCFVGATMAERKGCRRMEVVVEISI